VLSQLKRTIRANYSNPPTHGGQIVATVLNSVELRALWRRSSRRCATDQAHARDAGRATARAHPGHGFTFVLKQRGMFSYSGLTKAQVERLRSDFAFTQSIPAVSVWPRSIRAT
jgi:aromatic-amino-acid transaminase